LKSRNSSLETRNTWSNIPADG